MKKSADNAAQTHANFGGADITIKWKHFFNQAIYVPAQVFTKQHKTSEYGPL